MAIKAKKNYRSAPQIGKRINKVLKDQELIEAIANSEYPTEFISNIIKYYILSDDKKTSYKYEELEQKISETFKDSSLFEEDKYLENMLLAHSTNGYSKKNIKKNGLGKKNFFDPELSKSIEYLEQLFSTSIHSAKQENTNNETFFTMPGRLAVEYAIKGSPERLILGILMQDTNEFLPVKNGESKKNYYKRVLLKKLHKIKMNEQDNLKANQHIDEVLEKMFTKKPLVVLFPNKLKKTEITAYKVRLNNGEKHSIFDILNERTINLFMDDSFDYLNGGTYSSNAGNMVTNQEIPYKELGIIELPDYFDLMQIKNKDLPEWEIIARPNFDTDLLLDTSLLGGTGEKYEISINETYIYKPALKKGTNEIEKFRGFVTEAAFRVQKIVDKESAVFAKFIDNGKLCGSVQYKLTRTPVNPFPEQHNYEYTPEEINQLLREFITDYLLYNYDSHGNNFVKDTRGKIYGVDKEQSFKYIFTAPETFDIDYHPNLKYHEEEPIYNTIFKKYVNSELDIDFTTVYKYIENVEKTSDEYYKEIFTEYVSSISNVYNIDSDKLYEKIMNRKTNLRKHFDFAVSKLKNNKSFEKRNKDYENQPEQVIAVTLPEHNNENYKTGKSL